VARVLKHKLMQKRSKNYQFRQRSCVQASRQLGTRIKNIETSYGVRGYLQQRKGKGKDGREAVPWLRRLVASFPPPKSGFDTGSVLVGFVADKVALGQVFRLSVSLHRCSITRKSHLHHRVAQEASRLRCVRSICCGALHHRAAQ
jgi:hypothetical protein